jgi:uncharacterized LabA/DUF88 family protein
MTMPKPKSYIFIDASNIHYYLKDEGWKIDWLKFKKHYKDVFLNPCFYYYEGIRSKGVYFDHHPDHKLQDFNEAKKRKQNYFKFLKQHDYKVKYKPVTRVYDNTSGQFKHKCNFDVELTIDAIDNINDYDVFSLVSGDGDFEKLVKYLKGKRKKTIVIAPKDRLSDNLKKAANTVIYLHNIKDSIKY